MKLNGTGRWIGLAICLWAAVVFAETPVLTALGQSYTAEELGLSPDASECPELEPLTKGVIGLLFADYCVQNEIDVSEDDLKEFCRRQLPEGVSFASEWAKWRPGGAQWRARQEAVMLLTVWKMQKALFEKTGGRVLQHAGAPPQAFDAMFAYVAEREQAGDFEIHDAKLKLRFWECLRTPQDSLVAEAEGRLLIEEHPADRMKRQ